MEQTLDMNLLSYVLDALPALLETWWQVALLSPPLLLLLAAAILPFVVLFGLVRGHFGRKALYERCARQLAGLGNMLNWLFTACAGAGLFVAQVELEAIHNVYLATGFVLCGLLFLGTLLWTIVVLAWKPLRKHPLIHGLFCLLSGVMLAALPVCGIAIGRVVMEGIPLPIHNEAALLLRLLLPEGTHPFWGLVIFIHFFEAAAAGAIGLLWLVFRRHVDDFGRDYYVFAASWCAEWGMYGGWASLAVLCAGGGIAWAEGLLTLEHVGILITGATLFVSLLLPAVIWTGIARSAAPMRHKVGMTFALLFLIIALASGGTMIMQ